jgi:hypothetical protein
VGASINRKEEIEAAGLQADQPFEEENRWSGLEIEVQRPAGSALPSPPQGRGAGTLRRALEGFPFLSLIAFDSRARAEEANERRRGT